jgi:hypothetical protein
MNMPTAFLRKNSIVLAIALTALFMVAWPVQQARADNFRLGAHTRDLLTRTNTLPGVLLHGDYNEGGSSDHEKGNGKDSGRDGDQGGGNDGNNGGGDHDKGTTKVPEPGSLALLVCGVLGLFIVGSGLSKAGSVS